MAINLPRINGSALTLAQASRPDKQNFAICGWAKLATATATVTSLFDYFQEVADSGSFSWVGFVTSSNGTTMTWYSGGTQSNITTITAGSWFWWAVRCNSTTSDMRFWTPAGGIFTDSRSNTLSAGTTGFFDIGAHKFNEPWDGPVCAVKIFTADITINELLQEQWTMVPKTVSKLHSWYPMLNTVSSDAIKDFSGNSRNLTLSGATQPTAIVDSPPISWGSASLVETGNYKEPYTVSWIELETVKSAIDERVQLYIVN